MSLRETGTTVFPTSWQLIVRQFTIVRALRPIDFSWEESRMPVDLAIGLSSEDRDPEQTTDDYVHRQEDLAQESYRLVREHLQTRAERRKQSYDTRVRAESFKVGEWVWYHYPRRYQQKSPKWQKNFIGPYLIVREIPPVNFVLQRSRTCKPFVVHTDKIKRCFGDTPESWLPSGPADHSAEERSPSAVEESRVEDRLPVSSDAVADQSQTSQGRVPTSRLGRRSARHSECAGGRPGNPNTLSGPGRRKTIAPRWMHDYVC